MQPSSDSTSSEKERIRSAYQYYESNLRHQRKRDPRNIGTQANMKTRWEAIRRAYNRAGLQRGAKVLDVGCGTGVDLLRLQNEFQCLNLSLHGLDLLPNRIKQATDFASDVRFEVGSGDALPYEDRTFQVVFSSMVLSSILDDRMIRSVTEEMRRVVASDGVILCYDMRYTNPWNRHTRAIPTRLIPRLFPGFMVSYTPVTLLPPLARCLGPLTETAYGPLHELKPLRSHYLAELHRTEVEQKDDRTADTTKCTTLRLSRAGAKAELNG